MGKTKELTKEQQDIIRKCYIEEKRGQQYCAEQAGCTSYMVKQFLKRANINIRNFSEAASVSNINRAKHVNHDYFDTQSCNMAWLLGFLASDGCINKKDNEIIIRLSRVDKEILQRIKEELELEKDLKDYITGDKGYECCSLSWSSSKHKEVLAKYHIIPNKTVKLLPPDLLDSKYYIDYIRGFFDGDGSVNYISSLPALRWQVGSASKEILEFILDVFEQQYGIKRVNIQTRNDPKATMPFYVIQYSTNATKQIYKILYNTGSSLFLKRKKEHYDKIIKIFMK